MDITLCPKCHVRVLPTSEGSCPSCQSDLTHAGIVVMEAPFSQPAVCSEESGQIPQLPTGTRSCRMPTGQWLRLVLKRFIVFEVILIGLPSLLAVLFLTAIALRLPFLVLGILQLGFMAFILPVQMLCPWGFVDDFFGVWPKNAMGWYALFGTYTALAILLAWCTVARKTSGEETRHSPRTPPLGST